MAPPLTIFFACNSLTVQTDAGVRAIALAPCRAHHFDPVALVSGLVPSIIIATHDRPRRPPSLRFRPAAMSY
jgi:hypothetical protein